MKEMPKHVKIQSITRRRQVSVEAVHAYGTVPCLLIARCCGIFVQLCKDVLHLLNYVKMCCCFTLPVKGT